ncbi:Hypothetical_protein [Hexamita inflata]|uniref:Hypothetical_protein n=1 Tax=Hexamita inflata TaxID=28002 RepID=A0AA86P490_9EUKA|nr:Hypothetical protein HINF_LOCUS17784 [Hexamita inflata]
MIYTNQFSVNSAKTAGVKTSLLNIAKRVQYAHTILHLIQVNAFAIKIMGMEAVLPEMSGLESNCSGNITIRNKMRVLPDDQISVNNVCVCDESSGFVDINGVCFSWQNDK